MRMLRKMLGVTRSDRFSNARIGIKGHLRMGRYRGRYRKKD